jgi:hypothetical protein
VLDEHVGFLEAVRVEQDGQALAGGQSTLGMLRCNTLGAAAELGQLAAFFQFVGGCGHLIPLRWGPEAIFLPCAAD